MPDRDLFYQHQLEDALTHIYSWVRPEEARVLLRDLPAFVKFIDKVHDEVGGRPSVWLDD